MPKTNLRTRILRLAREKFFRLGFYRVSVDSLVAELRTSKSSIYKHFGSKEDLVRAVMEDLNEEINGKLEAILADDRLSFFGKLTAVSEFTGKLLHQVSREFLEDLRIHAPEVWEDYQQARQARIDRYYGGLFRLGREEGLLRDDLHPELLLQAYLKLTEITLRGDLLPQLPLDRRQVYEQISRLFLEGARRTT